MESVKAFTQLPDHHFFEVLRSSSGSVPLYIYPSTELITSTCDTVNLLVNQSLKIPTQVKFKVVKSLGKLLFNNAGSANLLPITDGSSDVVQRLQFLCNGGASSGS